jgi:eukaryotic-like serine/threonine-protein kinase
VKNADTASADLRKEEAIFEAAAAIADRTARATFLNHACGTDSSLRASVEELLAFHDTAGNFLEAPAPGSTEMLDPPIGAMIGQYKLLERIGEGGFGVVYRAEQQEPVRRQVAIKIIRLGMNTEQVIARFETERQTLALMKHPNIATVLDAGTTGKDFSGSRFELHTETDDRATAPGPGSQSLAIHPTRPYFVMELVEGRAIDDYCDENRLCVHERLKLFLPVCRAVQHAHQKGIVHRDLKPSNVLVTRDDSAAPGVPKVIDFGIAKAMHAPVQGVSQTDVRQLVGTPEYMSPEQITRDGADVDTRADIYALGSVLYKLLTGMTPLDHESMKRASWEEILRIIREVEPVRPSARRAMIENMRAIADHRSTQPVALRRMLRGELDWIVMKSLDKDRSRRYETASDLARDIERYLDQRPVLACPPSPLYLLRKFVRRNRIAVVSGLLIAVAVTAGAAVSLAGFVRAEREWQKAERLRGEAVRQRDEADRHRHAAEQQRLAAITEREKAEQVVVLLQELIGTTDPEQGYPADFTIRALLDSFAGSLAGRLEGQPEVDAMIHRAIGRSYWSLGNMNQAGPGLERALELRRRVYGDADPLTAQSRVDVALYQLQISQLDEAFQSIQRALPTLREVGPSDDLVWALYGLARVHHEFGELSEAGRWAEDAWKVSLQVHHAEHPTSLIFQAFAARYRPDPEESERLARDALDRLLAVSPERQVSVALLKRNLAMILPKRDKFQEAEGMAREALGIDRKLFGEESSRAVQDLLALAEALRAAGRSAEAEQHAREAVRIAELVTVEREVLRARAYRLLARILEASDPAGESEALALAIESSRRVVGNRPEVGLLLAKRGTSLMRKGSFSDAAQCLRDALAITRERPDQTEESAFTLYVLGLTLRELGDIEESLVQMRDAATLASASDGKMAFIHFELIEMLVDLNRIEEAQLHANELAALSHRTKHPVAGIMNQIGQGVMQMARGDTARAEQTLRDAATPRRLRGVPAARRVTFRITLVFSKCLIRTERFDQAEAVLTQLDQRIRTIPAFGTVDKHNIARCMVLLYEAWNKPDELARWRDQLNH